MKKLSILAVLLFGLSFTSCTPESIANEDQFEEATNKEDLTSPGNEDEEEDDEL